MYLFQELNIMELGFAKDKFIQFPTGQVPWQNQFHDIEFLEEPLSDITVLSFWKKIFLTLFFDLEKLVKPIEYGHH